MGRSVDATAIKTMKLYARVERTFDELRNAGIGDGDPLTVDDWHRAATKCRNEILT